MNLGNSKILIIYIIVLSVIYLISCSEKPIKSNEIKKRNDLFIGIWMFNGMNSIEHSHFADSLVKIYGKGDGIIYFRRNRIIDHYNSNLGDTIYWRVVGDTIILIKDSLSEFPVYTDKLLIDFSDKHFKVLERFWFREKNDSFFSIDLISNYIKIY